MRIVSTRWPLLEFYFKVWRFSVKTYLMTAPPETLTVEYIRLGFYWGSKELFHFRLYDNLIKLQEPLRELTNQETLTMEQLIEIKRLTEKYIKEKEEAKK